MFRVDSLAWVTVRFRFASQGITNPYGWTKFMIEQFLRDMQTADPTLQVVLLRYFNPVGAHPSGKIGENPKGTPNNLMPFLTQVATGQRSHLDVFGGDWPTRDGTPVRDYIHVSDLAVGHIAALRWLAKQSAGVCEVFNLGMCDSLTWYAWRAMEGAFVRTGCG